MGRVYRFMKKYIGPVEMVIIISLMTALCLYLDYREEQQARKELLQELKTYSEENARIEEELRKKKENTELRVMDSIYAPFIVDSLCRYTDSTYTAGYITMTQYAPYEKLCSSEESYYMWVGVKEIFPMGQLVKVIGIAQNEELIQFHFQVSNNDETLDNMLSRLDSTLQAIKGVSLK